MTLGSPCIFSLHPKSRSSAVEDLIRERQSNAACAANGLCVTAHDIAHHRQALAALGRNAEGAVERGQGAVAESGLGLDLTVGHAIAEADIHGRGPGEMAVVCCAAHVALMQMILNSRSWLSAQ